MKIMDRDQIVLVDTNVIIEAHRVRSWDAVTGWFSVETVDECAVEAGSGDSRKCGYVFVDVKQLRKKIMVHKVERKIVLAAELTNERFSELDPGEKELLAFAIQYEKAWLLCSPDRACMGLMHELSFLNRLVSLETMQRKAGLNKQLRENFTEKWLKKRRTEFIIGQL